MDRKIILIVDDELDIKILYKSILNKHFDFEIIESDSLKNTKEILENNTPDIVLLDLCLPDGDGYEVIPTLKEKNPNVKILIISAFNCGQEKEKVKASGAIGLLAKPFEKENFVQHIKKMDT